MRMSFESLIQALVGRGNANARTAPLDSSGSKHSTSVRLKPATRAFLEAQGEVLNMGVSGVIELILDGMAQVGLGEPRMKLETLRDRFLYLGEAHGLDYPAIVSIMADHGFTLSSLGNADRLLDLLKKPALDHWAKTFNVRTEWLTGASDYAVRSADFKGRWYKHVYTFANRVGSMAASSHGRVRVIFVRRAHANFEAAYLSDDREQEHKEPVGIVIEERRRTPDGTEFKVFEVCDFERWSYAPSRRDLKLLIMFFDQIRSAAQPMGREFDLEQLEALESGKRLPVTLLSRDRGVWYPEDFLKASETAEAVEWPSILHAYVDSGLHELAVKFGGHEMPEHLVDQAKAWRP